MEIRLLKYFLTVVEEQNITRAAKKLHITQPTLSRQIREFEESLQTELFVRKNKKLVLTEAGMYLKKRAEEIIELDEKTKQELINYQNSVLNDQISIGCVEATNSIFLFRILEEMMTDHPQITFDIFSGTSNDIMEKLDKGLLDIAVLIEPLPIIDSEYNQLTLPEKEIWGILVSNNFFLSKQKEITSEEIKGVPLINSGRKAVQEMFYDWGKFNEEDLNIIGKYNLISNVISLVESEIGVAFAIEGAINMRNKDSVFLPLSPTLETRCVLVWKKDGILSHTVLEFIKRVKYALKA